jgi:hypothetical protein
VNDILTAIAAHPWAFGYLALALIAIVGAARR